MKIKYLILYLAILALAACAPAARTVQPANTSVPAATTEQLVNTSVPAATTEEPVNTSAPAATVGTPVVTQAETTNTIDATCIRNSTETQLLINYLQGYCLQYPVGYDISFQNESALVVMKGSILNAEDPMLFIKVEPANGMTVEQAADQLVADYSVPGLEVKRENLQIDQEPAIRIDGLTGQDINRQVVVVHNDRVFRLSIMPMQGSPDVNAQAETLYNTVVQSFNFRPDSNLCPDCPPAAETP